MVRLTIYKKGVDVSGDITSDMIRYEVNEWTFQDTLMDSQYLTFNAQSENPIEWCVGDFCVYRGVTYTLNQKPSVTQNAHVGKYGKGFEYSDVKLDSALADLKRVTILDITPTTGDYEWPMGENHTGNAVFQLQCCETTVTLTGKGTTRLFSPVEYLMGVIKANLDRVFPSAGWKVEVETENTHTDDTLISFNNTNAADALKMVKDTFNLYYCVIGRTIYVGYDFENLTSADFDAQNPTWNDASLQAQYSFGYGKGEPTVNSDGTITDEGTGLYKIEKKTSGDGSIITRLRAYGSTRNLPYRWYNLRYPDVVGKSGFFVTHLQLPDAFETEAAKILHNANRDANYGDTYAHVLGTETDCYIDKNNDAAGCDEGIWEGVGVWDGSDKDHEEIYPTIEDMTYQDLRAAEILDYKHKDSEDDYDSAANFLGYDDAEYVNEVESVDERTNFGDGIIQDFETNGEQTGTIVNVSGTLSGTSTNNYFPVLETQIGSISDKQVAADYEFDFETGVAIKIYTTSGESNHWAQMHNWKVKVSAADSNGREFGLWTVEAGNWVGDDESESDGYWYVDLPSLPYVQDGTDRKLTLAEDSTVVFKVMVFCTETFNNGVGYKAEIYNRIGGKVQGTWRNANVASTYADTPFTIYVRDFGLDFSNLIDTGETPVLSMKTGACVACDFTLTNASAPTYLGDTSERLVWKLTFQRCFDSSIGAYYPSSLYPIAKGDKFVILNCELPDGYIKAAEVRLLAAATKYLKKVQEQDYTYTPSFNNIYLQHDYDKNGENSVYWNLYAGVKFPIYNIPDSANETLTKDSILIKSVSIKEGKLVPEVDVTLDNSIEETIQQRLNNTISRLSSESTSEVTSAINALVEKINNGEVGYNKIKDDDPLKRQEGDIKQLAVGTEVVSGSTTWGSYTADATGATVRRNSDGNWLIETDYLKVRKKATFTNVEIQDVYHVGGQMMLTSASCRVDMVDEVYNDDKVLIGYRVYFKKQDNSGQHVDNTWLVGDQAYCNTFNVLDSDDVKSNHFLWRLVTAVGNYPTIDTWSNSSEGKISDYIDYATQVAAGNMGVVTFQSEWEDLLAETKSIRDDAEVYLASDSDLSAMVAAMNKVTSYINSALYDTTKVSSIGSSDMINNGLSKYAECIDKLRTKYLKEVYHTITLSDIREDTTIGKAENSDIPVVDDNLVQLGYRAGTSDDIDSDSIKNRQGALILAGAGANSPYIYMFKNIGRKWSETKAKKELGETAWESLVSSGDSATYLNSTYFILPTPYMQFSPAKTVINSADVHLTTDNDDEDYDDADADSITNIFNIYSNQLAALQKSVADIDEQTDGSFRIWQGENINIDGVSTPIIPSMFPADSDTSLGANIYIIDSTNTIVDGWSKDELSERVDDFYIATDGRVWQFKYDDTTGYSWEIVTDEYLISFVNQVKEKKRVFLLLDTNGKAITDSDAVESYFNDRDYDIGDLWVNAYYYITDDSGTVNKLYDNDILVCTKAKSAGTAFNISDWNKANSTVDDELMSIINNISADNKIDASEKNSLADKFNAVVSQRASFYEQDEVTPKYSSLDYTEYERAYSNLCTLMYAVFGITSWDTNVEVSTKDSDVYNGTIILGNVPDDAFPVDGFSNLYLGTDGNYYISSIDDDSTFNAYWWTYYNEYNSLSDAILTYVLTVNSSAFKDLNDIANDDVIDVTEMARLRTYDVEIDKEHTNLEAYALSLAESDAIQSDDFSATKYNSFASAFNAYQQAYLDFHAIIDVVLNKLTKTPIFWDAGTEMNANEYEYLLIDINGDYVVGSSNILSVNVLKGQEGSKYYLNIFSSSLAKEDVTKYDAGFSTNVSFTGYGYSPSGTTYHWITKATYYNIISNYKSCATALQNEITTISQYLAEENSRSYTQSVIGAATADNILTANEKRAICQELNSIGSEMEYAITKAKELLGDSISQPESTETAYNAKLAVYNAYHSMLVYFNLLAGVNHTGAYVSGYWKEWMTNGIANVIGISRELTSDAGTNYSLGYTFSVDVNSSNIVDTYDLSNFFYYLESSTDETGGVATDAYNSSRSEYIWYIGRDGGDAKKKTFLDAFTDYYNARDAFANAITTYAKVIADAAQTSAADAQDTADKAQDTADDAKDIANATKTIVEDIASDGIISHGTERYTLNITWNSIVAEHDNYVSKITDYGIKKSEDSYVADATEPTTAQSALANAMNSYIASYNTLDTLLNTTLELFSTGADYSQDVKLSDHSVTRDTFNEDFNDYYKKASALATAISARNQELGNQNASDINDITSNYVISGGTEKQNLKNSWDAIVSQHTNYVSEISYYGLTVSGDTYSCSTSTTALNALVAAMNAYVAIYNTLNTLLNTTIKVFGDSGTDVTTDVAITETQRTAINNDFKDYYSKANALDLAITARAKEIGQKAADSVAQVVNDGIITPVEIAQVIAPKWGNIYYEYNTTLGIASKETLTTEEEVIKTAYDNLAKYISALGISINSSSQVAYGSTSYYLSDCSEADRTGLTKLVVDSANPSRADFAKAFSDYDNAIIAYQKKADDDNGKAADEANSNATTALNATESIASDGIISAGSEKQTLYQLYSTIQATVNSYLSQCKSYGITSCTDNGSGYECNYTTAAASVENVKTLGSALVTYVTAFHTLSNYLTGHASGQLNLFGYTDSESKVIGGYLVDTVLIDCGSSGSAFRNAFETYYTAENVFAEAFEQFKTKQLASASIDMIGGTIDLSATDSITIDSSKVKIGDSNLGAWFTIADGKLTGNGIKMNNAEFGTTDDTATAQYGHVEITTDAGSGQMNMAKDNKVMATLRADQNGGVIQVADTNGIGGSKVGALLADTLELVNGAITITYTGDAYEFTLGGIKITASNSGITSINLGNVSQLPTSATGLSTGDIYLDGAHLCVKL